MFRTVFLCNVLMYLAAMHTVGAAQDVQSPVTATRQTLPAAKDKELVMEACTRCHGIDLVIEQQRSPDEWIQVVSMMVGSGMALTDDEYGRVITYLSENLASPVPAAN